MVRKDLAKITATMLKAALKAFLLILVIAFFFVPVAICHHLNRIVLRDRLVTVCNRFMLVIIGVRVTLRSHPSADRPLLLVSNHLSYLDVTILASQFPVSFTPKSEIASWPVIGRICHITGSIFITRSAASIERSKQEITKALSGGRLVCLYPEGTTGNGLELKPFKSSFFSLAEEPIGEKNLMIQPVALTYQSIRRLPIDRSQWPSIAWYGDMELLPHLWDMLKLGHIDVEIAFLKPVSLQQFSDRKELAIHCQNEIAAQIEKTKLAGLGAIQNSGLLPVLSWLKSKS